MPGCGDRSGDERLSQVLAELLIIFLVMVSAPAATAGGRPQLQPQDCAKCHVTQAKTVAEFGGRHGRAVGCLDCHPRHPPSGGETTVGCNDCHNDLPHYRLKDCRHCHSDPHQPLESLRDPLKPARQECLSCHAEVGQRMATAAGRHAELFCNRCHRRHKEIPACLECHEPHSNRQGAKDCLRCHPAHQPLKIVPVGHLPNGFCRPCHKQQSDDLATTATRHGGIGCLYCHKGPHPATTACRDCHGLPHDSSIHGRFRQCLECHGDAHRLLGTR